jgi:PKD repeat protein
MKTAFHTLILFLIYSTNGFSQVVPCDASFTYTVSGNTITVTNTSTGSYSDAYWSFGVGAGWTLASSNPMSYTYSGPGTYWVNLGLSDSTGLEYGCDSAITVVTIDSSTVGVESMSELSIVVYPNPFQSSFSFTGLNSNEKYKLMVLNMVGSVVFLEQFQGVLSKEISVADLSDGAYYYTLENFSTHAVLAGKIFKSQ